MNLGHQIKYYRQRDYLSQESLAEKLYVSRQTISNWENDKSYPDIHNLLMLSSLFDVSLDDLVKGDVEIMERKLKESRFNLSSHLMIWPMLIAGILIGPAMYYWGAGAGPFPRPLAAASAPAAPGRWRSLWCALSPPGSPVTGRLKRRPCTMPTPPPPASSPTPAP